MALARKTMNGTRGNEVNDVHRRNERKQDKEDGKAEQESGGMAWHT